MNGKRWNLLNLVLSVTAFALLAAGCSERNGRKATILFSLSEAYDFPVMKGLAGRNGLLSGGGHLPDTNLFLLSVVSADGTSYYKDAYGQRPEAIRVPAGTYDVSVVSVDFTAPAFERPQFGDRRTVVVDEGETLAVTFDCRQLNAGLKILFQESFRQRFPAGDLRVRSGQQELSYVYAERRTGFFPPGMLKVFYREGGKEELICTRTLAAADMLTLHLSAVAEGSSGFRIRVDTTRNWMEEDFRVGSGNDGSSVEKALKVGDLAAYAGARDVWVTGFIVGGDLSGTEVNTVPPFIRDSHLAISDNRSAVLRERCAAVELTASRGIRDSLSLVLHPDLVGLRLYVRGDVETYFNFPGVKSVKAYKLE